MNTVPQLPLLTRHRLSQPLFGYIQTRVEYTVGFNPWIELLHPLHGRAASRGMSRKH